MKIMVDVDNTICYYDREFVSEKDYSLALPYKERIEKINKLYDEGNKIVYWTARGTVTQRFWFETTYDQSKKWGSWEKSL